MPLCKLSRGHSRSGQNAPAMSLKNPLQGGNIRSKFNIAILRDAFLHNHPSPQPFPRRVGMVPVVQLVAHRCRVCDVRAEFGIGSLPVHAFGDEPAKAFLETVLESGHIGVG